MLYIGSNNGINHNEQPTGSLLNYINYNCYVHDRSETWGKLVYIGHTIPHNPHEIFYCSPARGLQQRFSIFWRVAKQLKVSIIIVVSVRPDGTTRPPLDRFS